MKITCYDCGGEMDLKVLRLDPHEPPLRVLVCQQCEKQEAAPAGIESHAEERPKLPGF